MQHEKIESSRMKLVASLTSERDRLDFLKEVMKWPGGMKILDCIQCGLCAGSCPTRFAMDYSPTQIIRMIHFDMRKQVLSSISIWICSTCHTCAARCPRGIDITTLMMSLRNAAIAEDLVDENSMKYKFHKSFVEVVSRYGRLHEPTLLTKILRKTDVREIMHNASLGWRLLRHGKLRLKPDKIERITELDRLFEETNMVKPQ